MTTRGDVLNEYMDRPDAYSAMADEIVRLRAERDEERRERERWYANAVSERVRRVKAEAELAAVKERVLRCLSERSMSAAESCDFGDPYTTRVVGCGAVRAAVEGSDA